MSDEYEPFAHVIHIGIPAEATPEEADRLMDAVVTAAYDFEPRGMWDAFVWSHKGDCEESTHCCGGDRP